MHEQRRQVTGHGHLAIAAHRVVDGVRAGGEVRFALAERVHELVKLLQRIRGRQLEHGQGVDGGAQPAHGDGRSHAVPGHVADHQRDPGPRQRDGLVPVAADLDQLAAGQVAVLDLDRGRVGEPGRQHAPLKGQRGGVLPAVAAGVVDEDGGAGREVHANVDVVRVEPPEPFLPGAGEEAQHGAARDERQHQHGGAGQQLGHGPAPPRGAWAKSCP